MGRHHQNWHGRLNNTAGGTSTKERQQEEILNGPVLKSSQGDKVHWVLGPNFSEAIKAGSSESDARRQSRAVLSLGLHTELPSTPSRRELTLIHRLPSTLHGMDSYVIRNYTLLEINWGRLR